MRLVLAGGSNTAWACDRPLLGHAAPSFPAWKAPRQGPGFPRDSHVLQLDNPIKIGLAPPILAAGITSILLLNSP